MHDEVDQMLMKKYQEGDNQAFNELYHRHKSRVYAYILRRVRKVEDRDEVYQNCWTKFHRSRHLYKLDSPFLPWLFIICRSELIDYYRRHREHAEYNDQVASSSFDGTSPLFIDWQESGILAKNEERAIELRYYQDFDFEEMAKVLDTSSSNARQLVSRGLKKLRKTFSANAVKGSEK